MIGLGWGGLLIRSSKKLNDEGCKDNCTAYSLVGKKGKAQEVFQVPECKKSTVQENSTRVYGLGERREGNFSSREERVPTHDQL